MRYFFECKNLVAARYLICSFRPQLRLIKEQFNFGSLKMKNFLACKIWFK